MAIKGFSTQESETVVSALKTVVIDVTVDEFRDIFYAAGTGPEQRGVVHRFNKRPGSDQVEVFEQREIRIKRGGARIQFIISPAEYFPVGITFKLDDGVVNPDNQTRLGLLNFSQVEIAPKEHSLFITDDFKDEEGDDKYKFSIIVQRGADGRIGIIDPIIIHVPSFN